MDGRSSDPPSAERCFDDVISQYPCICGVQSYNRMVDLIILVIGVTLYGEKFRRINQHTAAAAAVARISRAYDEIPLSIM